MVSPSWAQSVRCSVNNGPLLPFRFSHVAMILGKMVIQLSKEPSQVLIFHQSNHLSTQVLQRLLKHVVRCYLRLSDNTRACEALCQCLPDQLKDETFAACLKDDKSTKHWLAQLLKNIEAMSSQAAGAQQQQGGQQPAQQHQPPKGLTQPPALA